LKLGGGLHGLLHVRSGLCAVFNALAASDATAARAAMREHLSQTVNRLDAQRAERPEYVL